MAEKVKVLNLERDFKKNLYYIDGEGSVVAKPKHGDGTPEILAEHAIIREPGWLYYIDKNGDISRSPMKKSKAV